MKQRSLNEEKVVIAATELAKKDGLESVTLTKTAKSLDIQPQSMYRYVKNTTDLKAKILANNLQLLVDQLYEKLIGVSGEEALLNLVTTVAFGEYTQIMPHDFAGVSKYLEYSDVKEQYDRLYSMLPKLLKTFINDSDTIRRGTQVLADYMLGESVTSRNNNDSDQDLRKKDFLINVKNIIEMLKNL
ncbi:TetR/AcrR family transcriptional regulator [Companilactobacillus nuruki]|uniref:HTH tetR-type domain-containing protein n=1 Tax=Companilactobacillus nuruki TaxID=1993540 RepID=A0A2N7AR41_9LACO|nr:TetR/AcrR family transcriptional regulator [Companilactobacillus nuruki]PMD67819.1 hypothetical protein CBP76_12905 [Companilactobacillus nuruki]